MSAALGSWIDGVRGDDPAGGRSRAALRRRVVRDHRRARGRRALSRGAPGAAGARDARASAIPLQLDGGAARGDRGGAGAGATAGNAQDHRHAWQRRSAAAMRPRAPNRRGACCRCGPKPLVPTSVAAGVALHVATITARRQSRARRHQTSEPARERDGRRRGRSGRAPSTRCCSMLPGTWSRAR